MADSFDLIGIHGAGDATPRGSSSYSRFDISSTASSPHHYPQSLALSHTSSIPFDQSRTYQPRRTIPFDSTTSNNRTPRRAPSPPSTSSPSSILTTTSHSGISSTLTSTTSIPALPPPGHFTLSIPCEFSPYLSCPLRFYHPAEWFQHCLEHYTQLAIPLPRETLCWFCDRYKWKGRSKEGGDLYESYLARMMHIAGEWERGLGLGGMEGGLEVDGRGIEGWQGRERRERLPRRDHFVLEHLWRCGVLSNEEKKELERPESDYFGKWARKNLNQEAGRRDREEVVFEVEGSRRRREERGRWR